MALVNSSADATRQDVTTLWTGRYKPHIPWPMEISETIDARGLLCPLPVLKLAKRLKSLAPGQCARLLADDPAAVIDVPHFCNESGHQLLGVATYEEAQAYTIKKTAKVP